VTTYPGPTKVLSANYTVPGTQFAIADEDEDALEPEDIWRQGRAVEEHQHDTGRGLPVRRIETASAPAAPGHVQILGDNLRWWADTADEIRTALTREGDQIIDGVMRFNQPVLMQAQLVTPLAPGAGLSYVYPKPDGRLYIRSGAGPEQGVGAPPTWNLPAKAWETDQVPGVQPALVRVPWMCPTWVLAFDPNGTAPGEATHARLRVPGTYVPGLPLPLAVAWTAPAGVAGQTTTWRFYFARCGTGEPMPNAWAVTPELVATYAGGSGECYQVVTGSTTVPGLLPGDSLFVGLVRLGGVGNVAGDAWVIDASVAFA
jgi:hypothetical protein